MELKDQEITQEAKDRFENLKRQYPGVFSLNSQDIGCTNLVTMHVEMGDSPPICQKPYTLPLKHYSWVQQEIKTLEHAGVIKKSICPWASPIVVVPKKSAPGEPPRCRMCLDFRKINELQPKMQRVDKQTDTQGNLSLIPLPKIDEMYANLHGAKIFTTLDLCSGYYHIALDNGFSDMARPLTKLLAHDCEFIWTNQCDISFQMLKDTLCSAPILKYPDMRKLYTLYTDASKYRWAGVFTQRHTSIVE